MSITFKSPDESFTLIDNKFFVKGENSENVIQMIPLDVFLLPIQFEDLFDTNQFCIVFHNHFYHNRKWFSLKSPYKEIKACILVSEEKKVPKDFNCNENHAFCHYMKENNLLHHLYPKCTLILPAKIKSSESDSDKGIVFSHIIPEIINLKEKSIHKSLTGTIIQIEPNNKMVNKSKILDVKKNENFLILKIDNSLEVSEPKSFDMCDINDSQYNDNFQKILNFYFGKKTKTIVSNLTKIIEHIRKMNEKDFANISMLESETSNLLRLFYNLKKNKHL